MTRGRWMLVALVVVLGAAGVAAGVVVLVDRTPGPEATAAAYLRAWSERDHETMAELAGMTADEHQARHGELLGPLRVELAEFEIVGDGEASEATEPTPDGVAVPFRAELHLRGLGLWEYAGSLTLRREGDGWQVAWSPAAVHPELGPGQRLARTRQWPERAPILGAGGAVLVGPSEVIAVGIEPRRIDDRADTLAAVEALLALAPETVASAIDGPGVQPDHFVPLTTLRPERYDELRPELHPVPGLVFRRQTGRLTLADGFADHVLGRVGDITAEQLEQLVEAGAPYQVGDVVGQTGLEAVFEERLAGRPSGTVELRDEEGTLVRVLHDFAGEPAHPVRTTLDPDVQAAAEAALGGFGGSAGLVAVDAASGDVLAVVSRPLTEGFNRALAGRYPPGSTFKVVTATALATAGGIEAATPVDCPETVTIGGRVFRNFEGDARGQISFGEAFVQSCNTAFTALTADLGPAAVAEAAERFGFGREHSLGLRTFGGRFPEPSDVAELAAAGIGQARVEVSALHMATVAATVTDGQWRAPVLVLDPPTADDPTEVGLAGPAPLDPPVRQLLHDLMLGVVAGGTGTAAAVPGQAIAGKTGTAEFGEGEPPPTHAWFIGLRGGLAVAVVVEDGGVGGRVAAPLARTFFELAPPR